MRDAAVVSQREGRQARPLPFEAREVTQLDQGAVRHVDDAHEPEDEGEAARDDEEQPSERDRIEQDPEKPAGLSIAAPNVVVR